MKAAKRKDQELLGEGTKIALDIETIRARSDDDERIIAQNSSTFDAFGECLSTLSLTIGELRDQTERASSFVECLDSMREENKAITVEITRTIGRGAEV